MEFQLDEFDFFSEYVFGSIGEYNFTAALLDNYSSRGINKGRTVELIVSNMEGNKIIASYCEFWDRKPKTELHKQIVNSLLENLENLPKRFEERLAI